MTPLSDTDVRSLVERIDLALREIEELEAEGDSSLLRATKTALGCGAGQRFATYEESGTNAD